MPYVHYTAVSSQQTVQCSSRSCEWISQKLEKSTPRKEVSNESRQTCSSSQRMNGEVSALGAFAVSVGAQEQRSEPLRQTSSPRKHQFARTL